MDDFSRWEDPVNRHDHYRGQFHQHNRGYSSHHGHGTPYNSSNKPNWLAHQQRSGGRGGPWYRGFHKANWKSGRHPYRQAQGPPNHPPYLPQPIPPPPPSISLPPHPGSAEQFQLTIRTKSGALIKQMEECPDAELVLPSADPSDNSSKDDTNENILPAIRHLRAVAESTAAELSNNKRNAKKAQQRQVEQANERKVLEIVQRVRQLKRQDRIKITREIREMHNQTRNIGQCDNINAMVPDVSVSLNDLPLEFIDMLSNTLNSDDMPQDNKFSGDFDFTVDDVDCNNQDGSQAYDPYEIDYSRDGADLMGYDMPTPVDNRVTHNAFHQSNQENAIRDSEFIRSVKCVIRPGRAESQPPNKLKLKRDLSVDRENIYTKPPNYQSRFFDYAPRDDDSRSYQRTERTPPPVKIGSQLRSTSRSPPPHNSVDSHRPETQRIHVIKEANECYNNFHNNSQSVSSNYSNSNETRAISANSRQSDVNANGYHHDFEDDIIEQQPLGLDDDDDDGDWNRNIKIASEDMVLREIEEAKAKAERENHKRMSKKERQDLNNGDIIGIENDSFEKRDSETLSQGSQDEELDYEPDDESRETISITSDGYFPRFSRRPDTERVSEPKETDHLSCSIIPPSDIIAQTPFVMADDDGDWNRNIVIKSKDRVLREIEEEKAARASRANHQRREELEKQINISHRDFEDLQNGCIAEDNDDDSKRDADTLSQGSTLIEGDDDEMECEPSTNQSDAAYFPEFSERQESETVSEPLADEEKLPDPPEDVSKECSNESTNTKKRFLINFDLTTNTKLPTLPNKSNIQKTLTRPGLRESMEVNDNATMPDDVEPVTKVAEPLKAAANLAPEAVSFPKLPEPTKDPTTVKSDGTPVIVLEATSKPGTYKLAKKGKLVNEPVFCKTPSATEETPSSTNENQTNKPKTSEVLSEAIQTDELPPPPPVKNVEQKVSTDVKPKKTEKHSSHSSSDRSNRKRSRSSSKRHSSSTSKRSKSSHISRSSSKSKYSERSRPRKTSTSRDAKTHTSRSSRTKELNEPSKEVKEPKIKRTDTSESESTNVIEIKSRFKKYKEKTRAFITKLNAIDCKIAELLKERRKVYESYQALVVTFDSDDEEPVSTPIVPVPEPVSAAVAEVQDQKQSIASHEAISGDNAKSTKADTSSSNAKNDENASSGPSTKKPQKYIIKADRSGGVNPVFSEKPPEQVLTKVVNNDSVIYQNPDSPPDFSIMHPMDMGIFPILESQNKAPEEIPEEQFADDSNSVADTESTEMDIETEFSSGVMNISEQMPVDILEPSDNECMGDSPIKSSFVKLIKYDIKDLERMKNDLLQKPGEANDFLPSNNNVKIEETEANMEPDMSEFFGSEEQVNDDESLEGVLDFIGCKDSILVIKIVRNMIVAASDKGKLYYFEPQSPYPVFNIALCQEPITSMVVCDNGNAVRVFLGSLDSNLYVFDVNQKRTVKIVRIGTPIQCLAMAWVGLYIGSSGGDLVRYCSTNGRISTPVNICKESVLAMCCAMDGARRVLVVAARNAPITIRDASSGLQLRVIGSGYSTIFSMVLHNNRIYCGTSHDDVLAFNFHDGRLLLKHSESGGSGVACLTTMQQLLFVGCYNGQIYVYNTKDNSFVACMTAPSGLLLSMAIVSTKLVVGTKQNFQCLPLPASVVSLL